MRVNPVRSVFLFEGIVRDALHALKYRGGISVANSLLEPLARAWGAYPWRADLLVPVPLHAARELRRGYNQAAVVSVLLGRRLGLPVASRLLQRVRNTPSQTKLNRAERQQNVSEAFSCQPVDLTGYCVVLIDDVATTGATLDACAGALLDAGAKAVAAFTIARAP